MDAFYKFIKLYPRQSYAKGEVILQQSEQPATAYVVKSGIVKSYNLTNSGEEKTIAYNLKDELFPIECVFAKSQQAQYYYEALTKCELYAVPIREYTDFLSGEPAVLYELFQRFVGHHIDYQMRINALEQSKASEKVLATLYFLIRRFGKSVGMDAIEIQVPFTQQDLANFMGLARETAAIELKKLERDGVISYQSRSYIIQMSKLNQLLGIESSSRSIFTRLETAHVLPLNSLL